MQLIDEEDDLALGLFDLRQNSLQPLFKFAPVLCARDQSAHIEGENRLVLQGLRHFVRDDPLREAFDDGRLADARLADENGVVFRFPGQNPDDVPDLFVAADDRIHLLLTCALDQIGAVFLECLIGILRRVGGHALVAADGLKRLQAALLCNIVGRKQTLERRVCRLDQGQQQMLDRDEVVLHLVRNFLRTAERLVDGSCHIIFIGFAAGTRHTRELAQLLQYSGVQTLHRHAHLPQKLRGKAVFLPEKAREQMDLLDLLVLIFNGQLLRSLNRFQRLLRILLCIHRFHSF